MTKLGTSAAAVASTRQQVRQAIADARRAGKSIGFVPTMGALHEGHLSLVAQSRGECGFTVVSIFVNPTQFAPGEDFERYPRNLDKDLTLLAGRADLVFVPERAEIYPPGHVTSVEVGPIAELLEGQRRPGHFRGVATVVLKLLNIVMPDVAYFGRKDYQQWLVIRRMVEDLDLKVKIEACPIVREPDGLALSSRNIYLSPDQRQSAVALSQSLRLAGRLAAEGTRSAAEIVERMQAHIASVGGVEVDYITLADPRTLEPVDQVRGPTVAAVAAFVGNTRLIDNELIG